jgi:antitoxin (DNA-binding transcriptional repressor) of toxin-antitoxin stability system
MLLVSGPESPAERGVPGERRESDNLIRVRRVSATEAARRFSDLLDLVERDGETFVVERRGRAVASIAPAAAVSGRTVKEILRSQAPDSSWALELAELRELLQGEERRWNG